MTQPRRVVVHKGETRTCENGHPIFDFARDLSFGSIPLDHHTTRWRQRRLKKGDDIPNCKLCGASFARNRQPFGMLLHFASGWRGTEVDLPAVARAQQIGSRVEPAREAAGRAVLPMMFGMFKSGKPH